MGIRRKLEGDDMKVINDLGDERVKREIDPRLQNCLAKSHEAVKEEVRPLIPGSPASRVPQLELARNETQFLLRKFEDPVLADIP